MYAELDSFILKAIKRCGTITVCFLSNILYEHSVLIESKRLANLTSRQSFRIVDGRLQALRKKRIISFNSKEGWIINGTIY